MAASLHLVLLVLVVKRQIDHGADTEARTTEDADRPSKTPLELATRPEITRVLRNYESLSPVAQRRRRYKSKISGRVGRRGTSSGTPDRTPASGIADHQRVYMSYRIQNIGNR